MSIRSRAIWFGILCGCAAAAENPTAATGDSLARAAAALPAAAFFKSPNVEQPALSPDGTKIAFLFPHEGRLALGVFERATKEARLVIRGTDESLKAFAWKGDEHLVFLADYEGNESYFVGATDLTGKKVHRIAESHGRLGASWTSVYVANWLPADPEHIIIAGWIGGDPAPRVVKLNVTTYARDGLFMQPPDNRRARYMNYVVDGKAQVRFATVVDENEVKLLYRDSNSAKFSELRRDRLDGELEPWAYITASANGEKVYVLDRESGDRATLRSFEAGTRTLGEPLFTPPEGEIDDLLWNANYTELDGVRYESERRHYHWFNADEAKLREKLAATFPGMEVRIVSRSRDAQVRLVWVGSDREPGVYFLLDLRTGELTQFKRIRDAIEPRLMRPMEPISFSARDGTLIHGYITRPFQAEPGAVPLIVYPHGGPYSVRDSWGFNPNVQFLASRGYAVLQVNYRGSGGYGRRFLEKGRRQWGRAMQDDLTDGVKWAIAQRIADAQRVAIYGASYGGFAALAGVTLTPDLYRCGVNCMGVSDLEITGRPIGADAWLRSNDYDYRRAWIGETKEYRDAGNPLRFVQQIRCPTFHVYGQNDPRVDLEHWRRLEAQLKKFGKPYDSMIRAHVGHGFTAEADTIRFQEALEKFFAKHLGPGS